MGRDAWLVLGSVLVAAGASLLIGLWWPPDGRPRSERRE